MPMSRVRPRRQCSSCPVRCKAMQIGFHLTPFWSPTDRTPTQIIDEAIEVIAAASKMGFGWVSMGNHWLSYPTIWPQPIPLVARLAPETGDMLIKTSVLLVPLFNAVDLAENVATLDHITHGRLVVGMYTRVLKGRMGFTPYQKPHPPLEMGAQSEGATKRAARITDGVFFGPQAPWSYVGQLADLYRATRKELGKELG